MEMILTPEAKDFIDEWRDSRPYVVAHTSGSTGAPKEIRLLKSDMRASAKATLQFFGINGQSTLYLPLSPDYIAGKMQIVRALEAGCNLIVEAPSNRPSLTLPPSIGEISLLPVVPSQVDAVLASPFRSTVKAMIVGGAPLSSEAEQEILKAGIPAFATYGMTETCSHVALRRLGNDCFEALPGFTFSLDGRGCLSITSGTLSFHELITNDIVELCSPTRFRWLGRYDNVINSGGIKIFPEEIEKLIAPLVDKSVRFYVTSRPSDRWGEEAVIVTDSSRFPADILDRVRELAGPKRAPKAVVTVPKIELTRSQKIIRRKISH